MLLTDPTIRSPKGVAAQLIRAAPNVPWRHQPGHPSDCNAVTVLISDHHLGKTLERRAGGWETVSAYPKDNSFRVLVAGPRTLEEFAELLRAINSTGGKAAIIRGAPIGDQPYDLGHWRARRDPNYGRIKGRSRGKVIRNGDFRDAETVWMNIDIDGLPFDGSQSYDDVEGLVRWIVTERLEPPFRGVSCVWNLSASAGYRKKDAASLHLHMRLDRPVSSERLHRYVTSHDDNCGIDPATCIDVQICYCAAPLLQNALGEAIEDRYAAHRFGIYRGDHDVAGVAWPLAEFAAWEARRLRGEEAASPFMAQVLADYRNEEIAPKKVRNQLSRYVEKNLKQGGGFYHKIIGLMSIIAKYDPPIDEVEEVYLPLIREVIWERANAIHVEIEFAERLEGYLANDSALLRTYDKALEALLSGDRTP